MTHRFKTDETLTSVYFSTCTITEWLCVFKEEKYFVVIIESLKYCIEHKGLLLPGYVIMPTHLHMMSSHTEAVQLSEIMRDFKHYTSTKIAEMLEEDNNHLFLHVFRKTAEGRTKKQDYNVWKDEYHPVAITSEKWLRQKMEYMHNNPIRKGFVEKPEDWKYSSARNWILEDDSIIKIYRELIWGWKPLDKLAPWTGKSRAIGEPSPARGVAWLDLPKAKGLREVYMEVHLISSNLRQHGAGTTAGSSDRTVQAELPNALSPTQKKAHPLYGF